MSTDNNIGLSRVAQVSLAATALAPVLIVWAAAVYNVARLQAAAAVVISALLVLICISTLAFAGRELQQEPVGIKKATRLDKDALAFLVTYALPLIAKESASKNLPAVIVFMIVVGLVLVQLQLLHVNPLLGMLGFHFYEIERADGDSALVISRSRQLPATGTLGKRLGPALWILK
jgi:hypothetical protein